MTYLGKVFALLNLGLSLLLATAAFSTYTTGVDWSDTAAKGNQPAGKLAPLKAELTEISKQLGIAEANWKIARAELWRREDQRRADRVWYAEKLRALYVGKGPVEVVAPSRPGAQTGSSGRPEMVPAEESPGVRLQPLAFYAAKVQELRDENGRIRKELEAKVKEHAELTSQVIGDPERKLKGLRTLINEERAKRLGITDEEGIVEGLRINTLVESELVVKRLESIDERVRELTNYLKKRHGVDVLDRPR